MFRPWGAEKLLGAIAYHGPRPQLLSVAALRHSVDVPKLDFTNIKNATDGVLEWFFWAGKMPLREPGPSLVPADEMDRCPEAKSRRAGGT